MRPDLKIILASSVAVALLSVECCDAFGQYFQPMSLPRGVESVLKNADTFTLFSIDPAPSASYYKVTNNFQGHIVLGQVDVRSSGTRRELVDALNEGISAEHKLIGSASPVLPDCFNPRHGIRAKKGDEAVELLICFECRQIYVTSRAATNQLIMTTGDPAVTFNQVLKDAGIPLPAD